MADDATTTATPGETTPPPPNGTKIMAVQVHCVAESTKSAEVTLEIYDPKNTDDRKSTTHTVAPGETHNFDAEKGMFVWSMHCRIAVPEGEENTHPNDRVVFPDESSDIGVQGVLIMVEDNDVQFAFMDPKPPQVIQETPAPVAAQQDQQQQQQPPPQQADAATTAALDHNASSVRTLRVSNVSEDGLDVQIKVIFANDSQDSQIEDVRVLGVGDMEEFTAQEDKPIYELQACLANNTDINKVSFFPLPESPQIPIFEVLVRGEPDGQMQFGVVEQETKTKKRSHPPTKIRAVRLQNMSEEVSVEAVVIFSNGPDDEGAVSATKTVEAGQTVVFPKTDRPVYDMSVHTKSGLGGFVDLPKTEDEVPQVDVLVKADHDSFGFRVANTTTNTTTTTTTTTNASGVVVPERASMFTSVTAVNISESVAVDVVVTFADSAESAPNGHVERATLKAGEEHVFGPTENNTKVFQLETYCENKGGNVALPLDTEVDAIKLLVKRDAGGFGFRLVDKDADNNMDAKVKPQQTAQPVAHDPSETLAVQVHNTSEEAEIEAHIIFATTATDPNKHEETQTIKATEIYKFDARKGTDANNNEIPIPVYELRVRSGDRGGVVDLGSASEGQELVPLKTVIVKVEGEAFRVGVVVGDGSAAPQPQPGSEHERLVRVRTINGKRVTEIFQNGELIDRKETDVTVEELIDTQLASVQAMLKADAEARELAVTNGEPEPEPTVFDGFVSTEHGRKGESEVEMETTVVGNQVTVTVTEGEEKTVVGQKQEFLNCEWEGREPKTSYVRTVKIEGMGKEQIVDVRVIYAFDDKDAIDNPIFKSMAVLPGASVIFPRTQKPVFEVVGVCGTQIHSVQVPVLDDEIVDIQEIGVDADDGLKLGIVDIRELSRVHTKQKLVDTTDENGDDNNNNNTDEPAHDDSAVVNHNDDNNQNNDDGNNDVPPPSQADPEPEPQPSEDEPTAAKTEEETPTTTTTTTATKGAPARPGVGARAGLAGRTTTTTTTTPTTRAPAARATGATRATTPATRTPLASSTTTTTRAGGAPAKTTTTTTSTRAAPGAAATTTTKTTTTRTQTTRPGTKGTTTTTTTSTMSTTTTKLAPRAVRPAAAATPAARRATGTGTTTTTGTTSSTRVPAVAAKSTSRTAPAVKK